MKILFFLINMNLGGTEKSFLNLLEVLPKEIEVDLLLLEEKGDLMKAVPQKVTTQVIANNELILSYVKLGPRKFAMKQLKEGKLNMFARGLLQYGRTKIQGNRDPFWPLKDQIAPLKKHYDIAVAYAGEHHFISWFILNRVQARKKVHWVHFDIDKITRDFTYGNKYYHHYDQVFCVAENAKQAFQKRFPKAAPITHTFNNIISEASLYKQAKEGEIFRGTKEGLRILTLGRLSEEKGQRMIPNVVKRLKEEGYKFQWFLIGDGKLTNFIDQAIKKIGIEKELILLGKKLNPYAYLRDCDLYVQTSFHEGDPVVLREAIAFKKAIITTNFLSASNLIHQNWNGLIVEISEEGIYQGVKQVFQNPELRQKFSKNIRHSNKDYRENVRRFLEITKSE